MVPKAEIRFCVRHHHANFRKGWPGKVWKELFWKAARASTPQYFEYRLGKIKEKADAAFNWIKRGVAAEHWSRSAFRFTSKCDILVNNHCEIFNGFIVGPRDKPIVSLFEGIRNLMMDRLARNAKSMMKHPNPICPRIELKLEQLEVLASESICRHAGGWEWQVHDGPEIQFVVDIEKRTCTCRMWQLAGYPCKHGVCVILTQEELPTSYVDECYSKEAYMKTYQHTIKGINGQSMWEKIDAPELLPPDFVSQAGRPRKERNKKNDEHRRQAGGKLGKENIIMTCTKCGNTGHNRRTCNGRGGATTSAQPNVNGASTSTQPNVGVAFSSVQAPRTLAAQAEPRTSDATTTTTKPRKIRVKIFM